VTATPTFNGLPVLAQPCWPPVGSGALELADADRLATLFKAVADPTRLRLLSLVTARQAKEACVCELVEPVGLSQGTVSHHLKILVEAGILTREQRGKWAYYAVVQERLDALAAALTGAEADSA
jgi:ArsR family transcriptional regulator, arsenate/arsenite/antimonite-responsive transcriptional repressor